MPGPTAPQSRKTVLTLSIWLLLLFLGSLASQAQDTGQICLQAFADDNGNGIRDDIEAPISRGVAASLLNERGVTIASLLQEAVPYAADGLLCFDGLFAGDYLVVITSSEYEATTGASARASVQPGAAPARIDFGAKPLVGENLPASVAIVGALDRAAQQTLVVVGLAAAGVIVAMSLLGALIYFLVIRRRLRNRRLSRPQTAPLAPPAGLPPHQDEADDYRQPGQLLDPNRGSPLLFADDDQDLVGSG